MSDVDDRAQAAREYALCGEVSKLKREVERQRDRADELAEKVGKMTGAATSAAQTAVTAIERIQLLQDVVDSAVAWRESKAQADTAEEAALWAKVDRYRVKIGNRS